MTAATDKALPPTGFTIRQLIWLCGGVAAVSKACGLRGVPQWSAVPNKHVITVANLSQLPIETIRPDLAAVAELYRARAAS